MFLQYINVIIKNIAHVNLKSVIDMYLFSGDYIFHLPYPLFKVYVYNIVDVNSILT